MNTHVRDNETDLRAGGMAIASQASGDFVYASSATQLARLVAVSGKLPFHAGGAWRMQGPFRFLCDAFYSTTHNVTGGAAAVDFALDSESYDPDALHDVVTNNDRITVTEAGYYLAWGHTYFNADASISGVTFRLRANDATDLVDAFADRATINTHTLDLFKIVSLAASGWVNLVGAATGSGTCTFGSATATLSTRLIVAGPVSPQ
mgnify:CR=1 FL=1